MPEYLAPGVYVEETSYRSKSIEGVSTTTTGFIGPTLYGPVADEPEILTSLGEFERTYGGRQQLRFAGHDNWVDSEGELSGGEPVPSHNFMWHAVRSFFENGGARLYVKRVYRGIPIGKRNDTTPLDDRTLHGGEASATLNSGSPPVELRIRARYPGSAGQRRVRLTLSRGRSILSADVSPGTGGPARVAGLLDGDVVLIERGPDSPPDSPPEEATFALARQVDGAGGSRTWEFEGGEGSPPLTLGDLDPERDSLSVVSLTVTDQPAGSDQPGLVLGGLPLHPEHERGGVRDSVFARFAKEPARRSDKSELPIVIEQEPDTDGLRVLRLLLGQPAAARRGTVEDGLAVLESPEADRSVDVALTGGFDGLRPLASDYIGSADPDSSEKYGLAAFEDLEDIAIVAAPGSTNGYGNGFRGQADAINQALIGHCERMRYRIAVLDSGDGQTISGVREMRARLDSKHAALYYPWVVAMDPVTQSEIALPPSGFVAGIYARNDRTRAVYKAPANEVVTGALRFETMLNRSQQEVLNPEGINCFRYLEGRGHRLWGARTISSDPEWKYVNLRRYFAYLERSIDVGTQWAVFEPNGERLWGNVRRTIEDFLFNEFQIGALLGDKPERAYFVKCDRSTMTQNDLDNGRLVCLIGVAPLRPAEFVIFRIGQWTADRRP
jgi:uncharacterized protein